MPPAGSRRPPEVQRTINRTNTTEVNGDYRRAAELYQQARNMADGYDQSLWHQGSAWADLCDRAARRNRDKARSR